MSDIEATEKAMSDMTLSPCPFGHQMRDKHFLLAPTYTSLNHGAFGTYPKSVQKRLHEIQALAEARPDVFLRYQYPAMLGENRAAMAEFLGVPVGEVVFVPNATTAINVVLRSLKYEKGDVILLLSSVYGSVEKTVEYLRETTDVDRIWVPVQYPVDDEVLVASFQQTIKKAKKDGLNVKIASFDTISSLPGVRVPWERLVEVCRAEGVLSMVDGAHGIGHIRLDLPNVQPDFLTSNCHK
jgi:selenocysteine lyase/cysteine desulfurase